MKNSKLCVLGSINIDHIIHVPYFVKAGETLTGYDYHTAFGGKGANQAVAAARLGASVQFIGAVGSDQIGQTMQRAFANEGIDISSIITMANQPTGLAMIQVADSGENSIVTSAGANKGITATLIEQYKMQIEQADILLVQLEISLQAVEKAVNVAKQAGVKVILNPAPARPLSDDLLSQIDIITPNETEVEILTDIKICNETTACLAANYLHQKGIATVIITLGEKGIYLSEYGQGRIIEGFKVKAIDTTAAGDTFNGGLSAALLARKTLYQAVQFAQKAAAISVTRIGAQSSIPTHQEVELRKNWG